jgi:hypothetical protein
MGPAGPHPAPIVPIREPQGLFSGRQGESLLSHQSSSVVSPQEAGPQKRGSVTEEPGPGRTARGAGVASAAVFPLLRLKQ